MKNETGSSLVSTLCMLTLAAGIGGYAWHVNQRAPIPTGPEAAAAQQRAISRFPALADANSPLNQKFLQVVDEARRNRPQVFDQADWPLILATEAAATPSPVAAVQKSGPWKDTSEPAATPAGYHYERSGANGNYVPVPNGTSWRRSVGGG